MAGINTGNFSLKISLEVHLMQHNAAYKIPKLCIFIIIKKAINLRCWRRNLFLFQTKRLVTAFVTSWIHLCITTKRKSALIGGIVFLARWKEVSRTRKPGVITAKKFI